MCLLNAHFTQRGGFYNVLSITEHRSPYRSNGTAKGAGSCQAGLQVLETIKLMGRHSSALLVTNTLYPDKSPYLRKDLRVSIYELTTHYPDDNNLQDGVHNSNPTTPRGCALPANPALSYRNNFLTHLRYSLTIRTPIGSSAGSRTVIGRDRAHLSIVGAQRPERQP